MTAASASERRRKAAISLFILCLPLLPMVGFPVVGGSVARAANNLEDAVKATFLLKFPAFISWPDASWRPDFNVCVVGQNPFGGLLREAAAGHTVDHRPVVVRVLETASANSDCQVMFVTGSASQSVAAALLAVRGAPVLTVTDGQTEQDAKGIINFVLADGRVRFAVNLRAAAANHISISSKLLSVALHVSGSA